MSKEVYSTPKENVQNIVLPFADKKEMQVVCVANYLPVDSDGNPAYLGNIFIMSDMEFKGLFKKYRFRREKAKEVLTIMRNLKIGDYIITKHEGEVTVYRVGKWRRHFLELGVKKGTYEYYEIFCAEVEYVTSISEQKLGEGYYRSIQPKKGIQRVVKAKERLLQMLDEKPQGRNHPNNLP